MEMEGLAVNIQLKKGVLELCVLSLLQAQDRYGYELVKTISENVAISEGTIYPLLRRLQNDGYVATYVIESQEGPPRKYYRLSPSGQQTLLQLIREWNGLVRGVTNILTREQEVEQHD